MLRRPLAPLVVALGCALATTAVWFAAFQTAAGARLDGAVRGGFTGLQDSRLEPLGLAAADLAGPVPFALLSLVVVSLALARGRLRHAVVVVMVLVGANVTTQLIKHLGTAARPEETAPAWPSGHTTAAMTLALCLVVVAPARMRPLAAAIGGSYAVAVGYGVILGGWHYPSDVLGAFGIATGWLALSVAAVRVAAGRREDRGSSGPPMPAPAAVAALAGAALVAGAVLLRPARVLAYAEEHAAFVPGAVALGAAGLAIAVAAAAALQWVERAAPRD
jgi:membrane-associated phospholipid phosphatase